MANQYETGFSISLKKLVFATAEIVPGALRILSMCSTAELRSCLPGLPVLNDHLVKDATLLCDVHLLMSAQLHSPCLQMIFPSQESLANFLLFLLLATSLISGSRLLSCSYLSEMTKGHLPRAFQHAVRTGMWGVSRVTFCAACILLPLVCFPSHCFQGGIFHFNVFPYAGLRVQLPTPPLRHCFGLNLLIAFKIHRPKSSK